jgi:hypothetical protein
MNAYSDGGWLSLKSPVGFDWGIGRHAADSRPERRVARRIVPVDVDCIVFAPEVSNVGKEAW